MHSSLGQPFLGSHFCSVPYVLVTCSMLGGQIRTSQGVAGKKRDAWQAAAQQRQLSLMLRMLSGRSGAMHATMQPIYVERLLGE